MTDEDKNELWITIGLLEGSLTDQQASYQLKRKLNGAAQSWRFLRRMVREGHAKVVLNLPVSDTEQPAGDNESVALAVLTKGIRIEQAARELGGMWPSSVYCWFTKQMQKLCAAGRIVVKAPKAVAGEPAGDIARFVSEYTEATDPDKQENLTMEEFRHRYRLVNPASRLTNTMMTQELKRAGHVVANAYSDGLVRRSLIGRLWKPLDNR